MVMTNFEQTLMEYPEKIEKLQLSILKQGAVIAKSRDAIKGWEAEQMSEIAGNKEFSNAQKREAELNERKNSSNDYLDSVDTVDKLELKFKKDSIKLERLGNEQRNYRALCYNNWKLKTNEQNRNIGNSE